MSKAAVSITQRDPRRRIAVISMHTSPTTPLGLSANGGLNVYVREICSEFSERGIATVQVRYLPHQRQAQPGALAARARPRQRIKPFEYPG